jgi:hypothetical protein
VAIVAGILYLDKWKANKNWKEGGKNENVQTESDD